MITERNQEVVQAKRTFASGGKSTHASRERRLFKAKLRIPMRRGISQHVIDTAERLMQEYQADLDYLKDR
jgi:hypothetical protein